MLNPSNFKAHVLYFTPRCLPFTIDMSKEKIRHHLRSLFNSTIEGIKYPQFSLLIVSSVPFPVCFTSPVSQKLQ